MTDWVDRPVLVTGGSGLLGSWLVRELIARGAAVTLLLRDGDEQSELVRSGDIRQVAVVRGALEDYAGVERAVVESGAKVVFHLGAQTLVGVAHRSPLATMESNIRGTYHLLEACRVHAGTVQCVVVASSDKAYGEHPVLPYEESAPLLGRHPYDVSKACADLLAQAYHASYDLPVAVARCGNLYGGGDLNWSRLIPGTLRSLLRGERPLIRSNGLFIRDYLYVRDAVDAYLRLAEGVLGGPAAGRAYNFSTGEPRTVLQVVEVLRELTGRPDLEPLIQDAAVAEIPSQHLCSRRAAEELDWTATFSLEEGLRETLAWYRALLNSA